MNTFLNDVLLSLNILINNSMIAIFLSITLFIYYIFYNIAKKLRKKFLFFIFVLPGTIMHELAHFIMAILLNGKPSSFSLIPKKENNSYTLGSVSCKNITFYNALFIGLAPLVLIPLSLFFGYLSINELMKFINNTSDYNALSMYFVYTYLLFIALVSAMPSDADIKAAIFSRHGIIGLIFYGWIVYLTFKFF